MNKGNPFIVRGNSQPIALRGTKPVYTGQGKPIWGQEKQRAKEAGVKLTKPSKKHPSGNEVNVFNI